MRNWGQRAALIITGLVIVTAAVSPRAQTQAYSEHYGWGGGGAIGDVPVEWWRDWDASYNYPPEEPRGVRKMWTVGKIDYRPQCSLGIRASIGDK